MAKRKGRGEAANKRRARRSSAKVADALGEGASFVIVIGHKGPLKAKRVYVNVPLEDAKRRYADVFGGLPVGADALVEQWDGDEFEVADIWTPLVG